MSEFLNGLSNQTWFVTIITFLVANLGTILTMALLVIRNKVKAGNVAKILEENKIKLNQETLDKIDNIENEINAKMNEMLEVVYKKLKLDSEQKKASVEANTLEIQRLIKSTTDKITETFKEG